MKTLIIACLLTATVLALGPQSAQAAPGDLDTSFGQSGFAFVDFGDLGFGLDVSSARGVAIQSDGKIVVAGDAFPALGFTDSVIVLARFNIDGTLDSTFGAGGRALLLFPNNVFNFAAAVRIQADGKIVVAGLTHSSALFGPESLALARFTSTGALDSDFGTGGKVTVDIGLGPGFGSANAVADMVIQGDGKIVVAGTVKRIDTGADFLLVRFRASGALDTSFAQTSIFPNLTGSVRTDFGGEDRASAIALQSDGKIVVAGRSQVLGDSRFAIARYSADGLLDGTFGGNGKVVTNFVAADHDDFLGDAAWGVAIQGDGKIVAVGWAETETDIRRDIALARFNRNGTLDSTFGTGGKVTTAIVSQGDNNAFAVVIQPDGKIVIAGSAGGPFSAVFALARYTTSGALDSTFGNGGTVTTDRRGHSASALAIQRTSLFSTERKFVVAGGGSPTGGTLASHLTTARFRGFSILFTSVGTFELAPGEASVAVHQQLIYTFTWTVPEPLNWHDLQFLRLRIRDGNDTLLSVLFDEAAETFSLVNEATGDPGPSFVPGSPQKLQTRDATLDLAETSVQAAGPTSPTVTLNLALSFKPRTSGTALVLEVAATDDQGNDSGFVEAGTLNITPAK